MVVIGEQLDLTYPYQHAGQGAAAVSSALRGDGDLLAKLQAAERPAILVGPGVLKRADRATVMQQVCDDAKTAFMLLRIHDRSKCPRQLLAGLHTDVRTQSHGRCTSWWRLAMW